MSGNSLLVGTELGTLSPELIDRVLYFMPPTAQNIPALVRFWPCVATQTALRAKREERRAEGVKIGERLDLDSIAAIEGMRALLFNPEKAESLIDISFPQFSAVAFTDLPFSLMIRLYELWNKAIKKGHFKGGKKYYPPEEMDTMLRLLERLNDPKIITCFLNTLSLKNTQVNDAPGIEWVFRFAITTRSSTLITTLVHSPYFENINIWCVREYLGSDKFFEEIDLEKQYIILKELVESPRFSEICPPQALRQRLQTLAQEGNFPEIRAIVNSEQFARAIFYSHRSLWDKVKFVVELVLPCIITFFPLDHRISYAFNGFSAFHLAASFKREVGERYKNIYRVIKNLGEIAVVYCAKKEGFVLSSLVDLAESFHSLYEAPSCCKRIEKLGQVVLILLQLGNILKKNAFLYRISYVFVQAAVSFYQMYVAKRELKRMQSHWNHRVWNHGVAPRAEFNLKKDLLRN